MPKFLTRTENTKSEVDSDGVIHLVESSKTHTIKLPKAEEFFQIYCRLIASLYELKYADDIKTIIKFCEIAEFNTGKVMLSIASRKELCEQLEIHSSNFSKVLKRLKDKQLIDGDKGSYIINPVLFWKGDLKTRSELLKDKSLSVTFNFEL